MAATLEAQVVETLPEIPSLTEHQQALLEGTLSQINYIRKSQLKKPLAQLPLGDMSNPTSCVIARAIGAVANQHGIFYNGSDAWMPWTLTLREFAQSFDRGEFPHLVR